MSIEDKKQDFNALMTEYSQLKGDAANKARCIALKSQVLTIVNSSDFRNELIRRATSYIRGKAISGGAEDVVQNLFLRDCFTKYDHGIVPDFIKYLIDALNTSALELTKKEFRHVKHRGGSLDDPDNPPVSHGSDVEKQINTRLILEEFYSKMAVCVIRISGKTGKPDRFFRAFATEHYIMLCREHLSEILDINENEAFNVMDVEFADYTLTEKCRCFIAMETTPCKTYAEIELDGEEELAVPFEPKVYKKYHNVSSGRITQKRDEFNKKLGIPKRKER